MFNIKDDFQSVLRSLSTLMFINKVILVPRAYDPSGLWLGSRALAGPDILSMRRVFVSHCQPIRFAGFDGKSVIHGLPVLDQTQPQAKRIVGQSKFPLDGMRIDVFRYEPHTLSLPFTLFPTASLLFTAAKLVYQVV